MKYLLMLVLGIAILIAIIYIIKLLFAVWIVGLGIIAVVFIWTLIAYLIGSLSNKTKSE